MIELLMSAAVAALLIVLFVPAMMQRWNAAGEAASINNVRQILGATIQYRLDNMGMVPMRASAYSMSGNVSSISSGWSAWSFAGKNCDSYWQSQSSGTFDEKAHFRPLNPYLQPEVAPPTVSFANHGAGPYWTFSQGSITAQARAAFRVPVCKSPGDITTRQRSWPNPTPGVSCYNDVGTSYLQNMAWWSQPGGPTNFTQKYNAGSLAISKLPIPGFSSTPSNFVFITDQIGGMVPSLTNGTFVGEFGGNNMSVLGFLDGRAAYVQMTLNSLTGPGYTLGITWP